MVILKRRLNSFKENLSAPRRITVVSVSNKSTSTHTHSTDTNPELPERVHVPTMGQQEGSKPITSKCNTDNQLIGKDKH